ncbi:alanine racemase [Desulfonatronum thiosulfatophilum]|uniref:Alanine racemase n=1 Tax=Desulfonatronum thiosulfatophilum TaxID=617002 RepID=A0A1G6AP34_9BACT|nr:alanine racemase [Desulfonatronum thiosulfatophilum]SDB10095.1 alanine racemase [Desulfonatronum thiosulfatophilum]
MPIDYNLLKVSIDLQAIQANYRFLSSRGKRLIAVIKSDAYGHGLIPVGEALAAVGADFFAVGTVEEAARLRPAVRGTVLALLGPQSVEDIQIVAEQGILPLVARLDQLAGLEREAARLGRQIPIALKFDTGMARLGFAAADVEAVARALGKMRLLRPEWLISHLATADEPHQAEFVHEQAARFQRIADRLALAGHHPQRSLVNSGGLLAFPELAWNAQRPGIALYGANPFHGTDLAPLGRELRPAMQVQAPVLAVHALPKGASISYGRTYVADMDKTVAIVAAGYADNYSRGLSNKGWMLIRSQRAKILGRVCMQLTAVDVTEIAGVAPGDAAVLLGEQDGQAITPEELASWWGTITYEVFCLLGMNRREYATS